MASSQESEALRHPSLSATSEAEIAWIAVFRVTRAFWPVPKPRLQKKDLGWGFQLLSHVEVTEVSPTVQLEVQTLLFPGKELERCVGRCERAEKNNQREMLTPNRNRRGITKADPASKHTKKETKNKLFP